MDVLERISDLQETIRGQEVFGEPYEKDGATVLPVARVRSGFGFGGGRDDGGDSEGSGGGSGFTAEPVGAYVIRDGQVSWQPALDLTRVIVRGQTIALVSLLMFWSIVRRWQKARARRDH